jgi:hypothetical protein
MLSNPVCTRSGPNELARQQLLLIWRESRMAQKHKACVLSLGMNTYDFGEGSLSAIAKAHDTQSPPSVRGIQPSCSVAAGTES